MPLHIVRGNITEMKCDAIVNAANNTLLGGGGVDGAIHAAAGPQLFEECKTLGGCETGDAKITKGYNLPSKYIIHTVGPIWYGGQKGEKALLQSCYKKSLAIAKEYALESVAFPLISSGAYGYPKDQALSVAVDTVNEFLSSNEMTVYLVVFDKSSFQISKNLYKDVKEYIDCNYLGERVIRMSYVEIPRKDACQKSCTLEEDGENNFLSIEKLLKNIDDSFAVTLLKLIDLKNMTDVECYKKANVSKQTWYKILNDKNYRPGKNTVIAFAISLELSFTETQNLLATVGFTLSKSSKFDVIIEFFIRRGIYDIMQINETLFEFDQPCLGV